MSYFPRLRALAFELLFVLVASHALHAQVPPNDECSGALSLLLGTSGPYANDAATTSSPAWCNGAGRDLWYRFDVPAGLTARVRVCSTILDGAAVELFDGTCANLHSLRCELASCNLGLPLDAPGGSAGTRYFLRVGALPAQRASYTIDLSLSLATSNDECSRAVVLSAGMNGPYSNSNATASVPHLCSVSSRDVWFSYRPRSSGFTVFEVCGSGGFDPVVEVLDGPCSALVSRSCDPPRCGTLQPLRLPVLAGQELLVRVGGRVGSNGNFTIAVREVAIPPNDSCTGALPLAPGVNGPFDLTGATLTEPWGSSTSTAGADLWFRWRAAASGELLISLLSAAPTPLYLQSYVGDCAQRTTRTFGTESGDPAHPLRISVRQGEEVLMRAGVGVLHQASLQLRVVEVIAPGNDECAQAFSLVEGSNGPFVDQGASSSGPLSCGAAPRDVWFRYAPNLAQGETTIELCPAGLTSRIIVESATGTCAAPVITRCAILDCRLAPAFVIPTSSGTPVLLRVAFEDLPRTSSFAVQVTERPRITSYTIATGCGPGILRLNGTPAPGQRIQFALEIPSIPSALAIFLGAPQVSPIPICGPVSCALGVEPWIALHPLQAIFRVPYTPWLQGASFAAQGAAFLSVPGGCAAGSSFLTLTDTLVLVFS